jgi:dTDP-glucose 4,6-dehydratase
VGNVGLKDYAFMSQTILVTGGLGFIGSHFIRLLLRERPWTRVVNLDKMTYAGNPDNLSEVGEDANYTHVLGDITDPETVERVLSEERPAAIVNFAAESHVDRSIMSSAPFIQTNVQGVQVLLDTARRFQIERFVQISTDEVYGDIAAGSLPPSEEATLRPSNPYSASKAAADLLCLSYHRTYRFPVLVVRSSNNYGPNQHPEKFIPLMIRSAQNGDTLPIYGDGKQVRDWMYVEDNAKAILCVVENGKVGGIYNAGAGEGHENLDVLSLICKFLSQETGRDLASFSNGMKFVEDRPGHDRRYAMDVQRTQQELGWSPVVSLGQGLRHTIQWYLSHPNWVERAISGEYQNYYDAVYARSWDRTSG